MIAERVSPFSAVGSAPATAGTELAPVRQGLATAPTEAAPDFAAVLGQLATDAAQVVKTSEATSLAGIQGKASVQQVVEAVMSAEQTLQGTLAIRDKVVSAYLELSRMQI